MDLKQINDLIDARSKTLFNEIETWKTEMFAKIEEAKNNEILRAIQTLATRLDKIEARLPEPEED